MFCGCRIMGKWAVDASPNYMLSKKGFKSHVPAYIAARPAHKKTGPLKRMGPGEALSGLELDAVVGVHPAAWQGFIGWET